MERGSEGSAAGGGRSDLSEWQWSKKSRKSASPMIFFGNRNRKYILVIGLGFLRFQNFYRLL